MPMGSEVKLVNWPGLRTRRGSKPEDARLSAPLTGGNEEETRATIAAMAAVVDDAIVDPTVMRLANGLRKAHTNAHVRARVLYDWLHRFMRFTPDPPGVELLQHPRHLLSVVEAKDSEAINAPLMALGRSSPPRIRAEGDCDDRAMLGAALARSLGLTVGFTTYREAPTLPYVHVALVVQVPGVLAPWYLDPQENIPFGLPTTQFGKDWWL